MGLPKPGAKSSEESDPKHKKPTDEQDPSKKGGGEEAGDDEEEPTDGDGEPDPKEGDEPDMTGWKPEEVQGYLKKLRQENAKYRTKAKSKEQELVDLRKKFTSLDSGVKKVLGIEEEVDPEEQAAALQNQVTHQQVETAILRSAYELGIPKEHLDYFQFKVSKAIDSLEEGEELEEEQLAEIAKEVKKMSGSKGASSIDGKGAGNGGNPPPGEGGGKLTAEAYARMGMAQKQELYNKSPDLYKQLHAEAVTKNLLK